MQQDFTTNPWDDDKLREECGVFGIFNHADAAAHTALGLHALQHRGQEAAGIVSCDQGKFHTHREMGHVGDIFGTTKSIEALPGHSAIGHVRYATTGDVVIRNVQPLYAELDFGTIALAHNGNLTNAVTLKADLVKRGCIFQSTTDTEVIIHLIALSNKASIFDRIVDACSQVQGAYSLAILTREAVIGVRDPNGVRPMVLGKLDGAHIIASETVALDIIGAEFVRDVKPGEMVVISKSGVQSFQPFAKTPSRFCIFEYIYFARPDSTIDGKNVYNARRAIGAILAKETGVEADLVVPVPDSGVPAAIGYAAESKIPYELGIIRNHYIGRTFIEPTDRIRHLGVKLKHNADRHRLAGKRVILIDDSIVRGTTSKKIVEMVRAAGAAEVHMRIASPPTNNPCFYGIATPEKKDLLAANHDIEAMRQMIKADSLAFISIDGLYRAMGEAKRNADMPQFCDACFTGEYAIPLTDEDEAKQPKSQLPLLAEIA
jgi:amidophosphoribosyltransferase